MLAQTLGPLTVTSNGSKDQVENTVRTQDQYFPRFISTTPAGCVRAEELPNTRNLPDDLEPFLGTLAQLFATEGRVKDMGSGLEL